MDPTWLIVGIVVMVLLIILTIVGIAVFSGIFTSIEVGAGAPPIGEVKVAYKYGQGPYRTAGMLFNETVSVVPTLRTFGVYYDDPNQVSEDKLRYAVGAILAENEAEVDPEMEESLRKNGFKFATFPAVDNAVKAKFPFNTTVSIFIAIARVYPALSRYVKEKKLCAHPVLEIYDDMTIHFMMPLSRQDDFYVPETTAENEAGDVGSVSDESDISVVDKSSGESPMVSPDDSENLIPKIKLSLPHEHSGAGDTAVPSVGDRESDAGSEHSSGSSFEKIEEDELSPNN